MSKGKQHTAEQFIKAIPGSGAIKSTIAKRVGCTWETVQKYINTYPSVAAAYKDESEAVNDLAQSTILKSIQDGNTQDAKWWLSKKRKSEFGEAIDVTSGGQPIQFIEVTGDDSSD
jgi:hypothetical protein